MKRLYGFMVALNFMGGMAHIAQGRTWLGLYSLAFGCWVIWFLGKE